MLFTPEEQQRLTGQPAAWDREALLARDDWCWELTSEQVAEIKTAVQQSERVSDSPTGFEAADFPLPTLAGDLRRAQDVLESGPGVVWWRGLSIDGWSQDQATRAFWGLSSHLGTPVSQSATGVRIFDVRDEGFPEGHPQARGPSSNKTLSFHTDRCDVIGFHCLQPALEGGENELVSSLRLYAVLAEEHPDWLETLCRPFLYQRHNVDLGNDQPYYELPVFSRSGDHFACFLLRVLIERAYAAEETPEMRPEQRAALDGLAEVAERESLRYRFRQQRGDLLWVNNFVTLHRRTGFVDAAEPELKRHLLRIWLAMPNSRPLSEAFAPAFGATQAGAIRGGMKPQED